MNHLHGYIHPKNGGYNLTSVNNGKEAFKKLNESKYDAVITDIRMPEMDGVELVREIRVQNNYIPTSVEEYFHHKESGIDFSQGICPECLKRHHAEMGVSIFIQNV